jgi:manganese/zinc/iron transport system permease protein
VIAYNTLVVLLGVGLLGAAAGMVGAFAALRRRALTGDALAHAALPGLCLAFLVVGFRSLPAMLLGALISGLVGVALISFLRNYTRIKEDAAIGIVLSVFFGAGVVLVRLVQNQTAGGSKAGLDSYILGKTAGIVLADVFLIGGIAAFALLVIVIFYKEFLVVVFDPAFGQVQGLPALALDLLLMALLALVVVAGLPAVGVVLMAALLILPSVSARFWSDRFGVILVLSTAFGLLTGVVGTLLSASTHLLPAGPVIVLVGTSLFLMSVLLAPRRGVFGKLLAQRRFRQELRQMRFHAERVARNQEEEPGA